MATTTTTPPPTDDNQNNYTEHNKEYFNKNAESYDDHPFRDLLSTKCANAILEKFGNEFDKEKTELMDFACGTGWVSQKLSSHVKSILGVDLSQGMVDVYNKKAWQQGIPKEEMEAICLDLSEDSQPDRLNGRKFDFVICASAYHHIDDIATITKILTNYLKPDHGRLVVLDLKEDKIISEKFHSGKRELGGKAEGQHHHQSHVHHTAAHEGGISPHSNKCHSEKHECTPNEDDVHRTVAHKGGIDPEELRKVFTQTGTLKEIEVGVIFQFERYVESDDKTYTFEYLMAKGKKMSD